MTMFSFTMTRSVYMAIAIIVLLFASAPSPAEQTSVVIEAFEYPPIYQKSEKPGVACEIVVESFRASNISAEISFVPVKRMISDVASGTVVAGIGGSILFDESDIRPRVRFSSKIMYVVQTFMYNERLFPAGIPYERLEDLWKYRIGVLNGSGIMRFLEETKGLRLVTNTIHEGSAKQLYHERIDMWAIVDMTGAMYMHDLYPDESRSFHYSKPYNVGDVSLVFSAKADPDGRYLSLFEAGLAEIKLNGVYMRIMADYYGGMDTINPEALADDMKGQVKSNPKKLP